MLLSLFLALFQSHDANGKFMTNSYHERELTCSSVHTSFVNTRWGGLELMLLSTINLTWECHRPKKRMIHKIHSQSQLIPNFVVRLYFAKFGVC